MNLENTIYFDNNATTRIDPAVTKAMLPFFNEYYFNPSSLYSQSGPTRYAIEDARTSIAKILGAKADSEIIFMGSATEANNAAIRGVLTANPDRKHIITTSVEHPSVYELCKDLIRSGYEVTFLAVDEDGQLNIKELINAIRPDTAIVSIMHANNETGIINPIEKLSRIVKMTDSKIVFHTDATQTVGKLPINLTKIFPYVDMLSFSGHKIYAPKGIGVLYNKIGTRWRPLIIGGHQEKGRRAGTENVPYIIGLNRALLIADEIMQNTNKNSQLKILRDDMENFLIENISAIKINGQNSPRLESTISVSFCGIEGESIIYALNEYKICASTGSACSSGSLSSSHVLTAMNLSFSYAHGTIRFSFGRFNTPEEFEKLKKAIIPTIKNLRQISPFWDNTNNIAINMEF